jgi:Holliday junction resolvasome RuvABC DNA-binding subunit
MACRLLAAPVAHIARAIELGDVKFLRTLPGVGATKARDITNALRGKVADFASLDEHEAIGGPPAGIQQDAIGILVQLGYTASDARELVHAALARRPEIGTTDELVAEAFAERA